MPLEQLRKAIGNPRKSLDGSRWSHGRRSRDNPRNSITSTASATVCDKCGAPDPRPTTTRNYNVANYMHPIAPDLRRWRTQRAIPWIMKVQISSDLSRF